MEKKKKIFMIVIALLMVILPITFLSLRDSKKPEENSTESTSEEKEASKENEPTVIYSVEGNATVLKSATLLTSITNEEKEQQDNTLSKNEQNKIISFTQNLTNGILSDLTDENIICSPLSCYIALSMCAQLTAGESEKQLLTALDVNDLSELQQINGNILKKLNFRLSDKEEELSFANSFWINSEQINPNDKEQVNPECLDLLTEYYGVDTITAEFSKENAAKAMSGWVSEKTRNLLSIPPESFSDINDSIASIINTIYYKSSWETPFKEENTIDASFKLKNGKTVETKYMTEIAVGQIFTDKDCTVYSRELLNGNIHFILPKDDADIKELISRENGIQGIISKANENFNYDTIDLRIPKFDFNSKFGLVENVERLGVKDIFKPYADFSRFSNQTMFVGAILQEATIALDEKGCTAAAYTQIRMTKGEGKSEGVEFYLDRPFGFIIEYEGVPLFVGVVNNPNE